MKKLLINIKTFMLNLTGRAIDRMRVKEEEVEAYKAIIRSISPMKPHACEKYMAKNKFTWMMDPIKGYFDYVSNPWFTLKRSGGDCDDFAAFWVRICRDTPSLQFTVCKEGSNHRMVCFNEDGKYLIASNNHIAMEIVPDDIKVKNKFGEIDSFESAIMAATKIMYKNTRLKSIKYLNKKGYVVSFVDI